MFIASFFGWFLGEFFRSTLLLIGGAILALILVPLLFLFIAEFVHPLLTKNGSPGGGAIKEVQDKNGKLSALPYKFNFNEYEHIIDDDPTYMSVSTLGEFYVWINDKLRVIRMRSRRLQISDAKW